MKLRESGGSLSKLSKTDQNGNWCKFNGTEGVLVVDCLLEKKWEVNQIILFIIALKDNILAKSFTKYAFLFFYRTKNKKSKVK